jgi:hypothetical protein
LEPLLDRFALTALLVLPPRLRILILLLVVAPPQLNIAVQALTARLVHATPL